MRVAFRVDGSAEIGVGHVYRCLTLAKALDRFGFNCTFYTRNISENLREKISMLFTHISLNLEDPTFVPVNDYSNWLGVSQELDAMEFLSNLEVLKPDFVVVDHYAIDYSWESKVRSKFKLLVLDDLANRMHDCNTLVDQSIGRSISCYKNLVPSTCRLLVGPKYALLRDKPEYINLRTEKRFHVFINFGGADKDNYTDHVLNLLLDLPDRCNYAIKVVIGSDYPYAEALTNKVKELSLNIEIIQNPENMFREIAECHIAIGGAGVSLLERSALGIPSIVYAIARNQVHICKEYARQELGWMLEKGAKNEKETLYSIVNILLDSELLRNKSQLNYGLVDFNGTRRVIPHLLKDFDFISSVTATLADANFIFSCRYHAVNTSFYVNPKVPNYDAHVTWLSGKLSDERCKHVIFRVGDKRCGYVRLDGEGTYTNLSIYLHPKFRGKGIAEIILLEICGLEHTQKLRASVHEDNQISLRLFLRCNFRIINHQQNMIRLEHC